MAYVFRDIAMTGVLITVNLISLWYVERHFLNRLSLLAHRHTLNRIQHIPDSSSLRSVAFQQQGNNNTVTNQAISNKTKMERRMTFMAVCICTISTFEHLVYISSVAFPYFSRNLVNFNVLFTIANAFVNVKHATYFFILIIFNKNFRKQLVLMFFS
jgi:hypothetical protein